MARNEMILDEKTLIEIARECSFMIGEADGKEFLNPPLVKFAEGIERALFGGRPGGRKEKEPDSSGPMVA